MIIHVTPKKGAVTWQLDPDKTSDFVDVQGQWYVAKHPTKQGWSRVWYRLVALPPWLPGPIVVQLCKTGHEGLLLRQEGGRGACFFVVGARAPGFRPRFLCGRGGSRGDFGGYRTAHLSS